MKEITSVEQFNEIINGNEKVVVKFYTNWCPDCVRLNMFIGEIQEKYTDLNWYQMNKDDIPSVAEEQNVMGIPSLLVFKNGEKLGHLHSAYAKTPEEVDEFLASV